VKLGICDYCNTTDFDALLLGSPNILKIEQIHSRKITGIIYNSAEVLKQLNLNRFQLVDLGILIGTDFNSGIQGIGLKTGLD
jgi:flap endonuclease-1